MRARLTPPVSARDHALSYDGLLHPTSLLEALVSAATAE